MKFSESEYTIDKRYAGELRSKRAVFVEETGTKKAVHIALVTPVGLKRNSYYDVVQSVITGNDLFKE